MHWSASLSVPSLCDHPRDVAMATNFVARCAKLTDPTFIRHVGTFNYTFGGGGAAISNRIHFTIFARGDTVRPGGLHARFCWAFLSLV